MINISEALSTEIKPKLGYYFCLHNRQEPVAEHTKGPLSAPQVGFRF